MITKVVKFIVRFAVFVIRTIKVIFTRLPHIDGILTDVYDIGFKTMPVVIFVAIFIGTNLALQGFYSFKKFGGENLLGMFVALAGIREMAPIVAGAMVAAKGGSDIASRIATMRIKQQIDALEVMAVDPFWFLIVPKFIAILIVMPALVLVSDFFCLVSGYFASVYQLGVSGGTFMEYVSMFVGLNDIMIGMMKGVIFGLIICFVACFFGFNSAPGPEGVGRATNKAVVWGCLLSIVSNYFLTGLFYD